MIGIIRATRGCCSPYGRLDIEELNLYLLFDDDCRPPRFSPEELPPKEANENLITLYAFMREGIYHTYQWYKNEQPISQEKALNIIFN